jgi:hypothetical protein
LSPKNQLAALNRIAAGKSIGAASTIAEYLAGQIIASAGRFWIASAFAKASADKSLRSR